MRITKRGTCRMPAAGRLALLVALLAGTATGASATTRMLADAWLTDAAPGEGYDLLLELDPDVVYLGGLIVSGGTSCIHGNGAIVDLGGDAVRVFGYRARLDVDGIVFIGGGSGPLAGALHHASGTQGHVRSCVFYGCSVGLRMEAIFATGSSVTNCIFAGNTYWGAMFHDVYTPSLVTSVAWENGSSTAEDYAVYCGCVSEDPESWEPAGNGCFHGDPMFIAPSSDPDACDFHLGPGSPCWGAGTPAGTNIGAYPDDPLPVRHTTWAAVKAAFRAP